MMSNSLDQKVKKLYAARSKREAELHAIHEDILRCINSQSRRVKVERLVTKCNEAFMNVVDKNEDLIAFAGKTKDPSALVPSLESYLEAMTTKNDKILTSARNYIKSADDKVSEFQETRASIRSRLPSIITSSKTSSQRKHDYVIAKMKREEIGKQNEAAIRLAKQKKQMEIDELEENHRKRLAEATLQEFELLDAVSKGSQSGTTASARSSMRSEKAVQDWINTSLALSFHNEEKTSEPQVMIDPPECPSHNNGKTVEDQNTEISRHSIPKNCRGNYNLSNETLQQLDPYYTPPENFLAAANTQALYQAHLRAQMNQTGQQGTALPSITNQGTVDSQPPSVHAPGASSPPIQQPIPPQTFAPQENQNNASEFFPHAQSRGPETSSLPKNNLAQRICSRQQINCVPRAPNATLPPFPTTNHPAPAINVPLHPSAPPSPNTQQHNTEPAHPNDLPIPNPVFAPNLTAPIPHAPLDNQPLVKTFQNSNNRVHKVVRSVAPPVPNMPNIPLGQNFVPNMSHWRFPQHRPSIFNQDTTTVNSLPPNVHAHINHQALMFHHEFITIRPL